RLTSSGAWLPRHHPPRAHNAPRVTKVPVPTGTGTRFAFAGLLRQLVALFAICPAGPQGEGQRLVAQRRVDVDGDVLLVAHGRRRRIAVLARILARLDDQQRIALQVAEVVAVLHD